MKHTLLAVLLCAIGVTSIAQTNVLTPSPIGVVLTVGQWLYKDQKKVYTIEVQSSGSTFVAAKSEGFRIAVEQAVGTVVTAESKARNGAVIRNEIISYSSGFVEKYEILEREEINNKIQLKMRVLVSHSAIADRLLNKAEIQGRLDGPQIAAFAETALEERQTGDQLLKSVVADYPYRAFVVELKSNKIRLVDRTIVMQASYKLRWSYKYLTSLAEALSATAQDPRAGFCDKHGDDYGCRSRSYVRVVSGRPPADSGKWFGWNGTYGYNDNYKYNILSTMVTALRPAVQLTIRDDEDRIQYRRCNYHPELDHQSGNIMPTRYFAEFTQYPPYNASLNGDLVVRFEENINFGSGNLENLFKVELKVVRQSDCS